MSVSEEDLLSEINCLNRECASILKAASTYSNLERGDLRMLFQVFTSKKLRIQRLSLSLSNITFMASDDNITSLTAKELEAFMDLDR